MRNQTSIEMTGLGRQGIRRSALYVLPVLAILGWGANQAGAAPFANAAYAVGPRVSVVGTATHPLGATVIAIAQAGADVQGGSAVSRVVSNGGDGGDGGGDRGGGGAMALLTVLALLTMVVVGWWRTRSAFLLSAQEAESDSRDPLP